MGDRVSVQFKNGEDTSVVLFNHWGGMGFVEEVKKWVKNFEMHVIANWKHKNHSTPITRCDVENLMVQFIASLGKHEKDYNFNQLVSHSLYLGKTQNDGDNSDNGHHIIEVGDLKEKFKDLE